MGTADQTEPGGPVAGAFDLLTSAAYRQYRDTLPESQRLELDLFHELNTDRSLMRVLYVTYMGIDDTELPDREIHHATRAQAHRDGLIYITGRHTRLSRDGFAMFWAWKQKISPHLRKPAYQQLWREVCGW